MQDLPGVSCQAAQILKVMSQKDKFFQKGTNYMSPKELLYIEDALGHTEYLMKQCKQAENTLSDPVLRRQAQQLYNANQRLFQSFFNLV